MGCPRGGPGHPLAASVVEGERVGVSQPGVVLKRAEPGHLLSVRPGARQRPSSAEVYVRQWLARELRQETAGNPFFLREMLRHLDDVGVIAAPQGGERELRDESSLRRRLAEAERQFELGAITAEEYEEIEDQLLARLEDEEES